MKKLFLWAAFTVLLGACSAAPNIPSQDTGSLVPIDTSAEAQAKYKKEWLALTAGKVFFGEANLYGAGAFGIQDFAFDSEGNLHNSSRNWPKWYSLHRVLAFKSGTEAIVTWYKSATGDAILRRQVYGIEIKDGKLYRNQNVVHGSDSKIRTMGFSTIDAWDGKSYSSAYFDAIGILDTSLPAPSLTVPGKDS